MPEAVSWLGHIDADANDENVRQWRVRAAVRAAGQKIWGSLAVAGNGLEATADLVEKVKKAGAEQIVIDPGARDLKGALQALTLSRRARCGWPRRR